MNNKRISDLMSLKGETSIVTGGAGHLGSIISETLAELGSDVIMIGRKKDVGVNLAKKLSNEFGIKAIFEEVDLNSMSSIDEFFAKTKIQANILINNAFTWPSVLNPDETSWMDFEKTLESGITSPFYVTKKVVSIMKVLGRGTIVNIGSMYGMVSPNFKIYHEKPNMGNALAYNAAKASIIQMTKYLAVYYAKYNIRINCISPGPFPRPGTFSGGKEWFENELKEMNPLHKLGEPWHIKGAIALLATELGSYMTGQNISVDGGWTIW